ncbi:Uncharacterised protein [Brucella neotomae]|nr:Uncharacterised protein [Brucella neotomae]
MSFAVIGQVDQIPFARKPTKSHAEGHRQDKSQKRDPGKTCHASSKQRAKVVLEGFLPGPATAHDLAIERAAYLFQISG